jgi:hypothetical protein
MNRCPKVGARVKLKRGHRFGELTGTVCAIYPQYDDVFDNSGDFIRRGPPRPEHEWYVGVKVDAPLPANWSYVGTDRFAPLVSSINYDR